MSSASWRLLLLVICGCCIAINAVSLFTDSVESSSALGFQVSRTSDPMVVRVDAVDAGGAAETSGLHAGDLLQLRGMTQGNHYRVLTGVYPHERIPLVVTRDGRTLDITYVAGGPPAWRWDVWVYCIASFWMLGFATFIAWRRADLPEARALSMILALTAAGNGLALGSWMTSSPLADAIAATIGIVLVWLGCALLATYAAMFGRPLSKARLALTALAYACAATLAIYLIARILLAWTGALPWVAQTYGPEWNFWYGAIPYAVALCCALAALAAAGGAERSRIAWTIAPLGVFYVAQGAMFLVPVLWSSAEHGSALIAAYSFVNVGSFVAPLGMTYALLNRRVLDIGFALNRVAIFSGVSLIVVGAFMLVEWALGTWLQQTSHTASLVVGAAFALLLGFSIRFVHARVEFVLDRVLFRKRHEDEEAIQYFAREAPYITDRMTLLERTAAVLERHADASFVRIALDDGMGHYGAVSENDPAILALRTWHTVLDLHAVATQLEGEYAYPIVARGRLIGALVLGPKRSRETYAPDESHAIEETARSVGGALDVLQQVHPNGDGAIVQELRAVQEAIRDGFAALQSMIKAPRFPTNS